MTLEPPWCIVIRDSPIAWKKLIEKFHTKKFSIYTVETKKNKIRNQRYQIVWMQTFFMSKAFLGATIWLLTGLATLILKYLKNSFFKSRTDSYRIKFINLLVDRWVFEFGLNGKETLKIDHHLVNKKYSNRLPLTLEINYPIN